VADEAAEATTKQGGLVDLETDAAAIAAARAADAKGGTDTVILRVGEVLGITELFMITGVRNPRMCRAVVDEVEARVRHDTGRSPKRVEGLDDLHWVLMDYGDWVAHVFLDDTRRFYDLERLWADVPRVAWVEP